MSVIFDIAATWRSPRISVRARLTQGVREDGALAVLIAALVLIFIAQWPGLARAAALEPGVPLTGRMVAALLALLALIPVIYVLAGLSHLVARALGGQGSWYGARLALFWSLLAVAPLMLVQGLLAGFVGPGVVLQVFGLSVAIAFVILWLTALREAERDLATGR